MHRLSTITTLLILSSCSSIHSSHDRPEPVEQGLLVHVPDSEKGEIEEARGERAKIEEQLAIAQRDLEQVQSQNEMAEGDLAILEDRLDEARDKVEYAREYGTQDDLADARENLRQTQAAVRLARTQAQYHEDLEDLAESMVEMEDAWLAYAQARVELREAEAISKLDRPAAQGYEVDEYEEELCRLEDELAMAQVDARAARLRVDLRREFMDERTEAVPASFRLSEPEPIDEVLTVSLYEGDEPWQSPSHESEKERAAAEKEEMSSSEQP
jgi:chromosome segregation ATPase